MAYRSAISGLRGLVAQCIEKHLTLETLPLAAYKAASDVFDQDVCQAIALKLA
ncbi:MAG: hypothetical protein ACLT0Y_04580 [Christensenellales bacterium]